MKLKTQLPIVYGWIKKDGLPARRVGRRWLIDPDELAAWIDNNGAPLPLSDPTEPSSDWLAEQLARFTADDLRRAAEVLLALAGSAA